MIDINEIYLAVQKLANKSQSGYITPSDFNSASKIANIQLFNHYYGSENQYLTKLPLPKIAYAATQKISESLKVFIEPDVTLTVTNGKAPIPDDVIHVIAMTNNYVVGSTAKQSDIRRVEYDRWNNWVSDVIDTPNQEFPIYKENNAEFEFYPISLGTVKIDYLRTPTTPIWSYTVSGGRPVYDSGTSVNFEWSEDERSSLIMRILSLCGISLQDNNVVQYAESQERE